MTGDASARTFDQVFSRCYVHGRRWDEGLWRYFEVRAVAELLAERPTLIDGPILDVGCGDGELFEWLFGTRADACGVDSCDTRADDLSVARSRGTYGEIRSEDARALSLRSDRFRLVFSNSVLEHVNHAEEVLAQAHRVLQPGGHLLFTTPDPRLYDAPAYEWRQLLAPFGLDVLGRWMARWECHQYRHVSLKSATQWTALLQSAGFSAVECRSYVALAAARAITRFSGPSRVPGLRRMAWLMSREARSLSSPIDLPVDVWVKRARRVLDPFIRARLAGPSDGVGLLVLARKAASAT